MNLEHEKNLLQVKELVVNELSDYDAQVYLFGSWARGEQKRTSDVDIGIQHDGEIVPSVFMHIRFLLEESTIPYRVDVVDLLHAGEVLVEKVKKEGILWKDYLNVSK